MVTYLSKTKYYWHEIQIELGVLYFSLLTNISSGLYSRQVCGSSGDGKDWSVVVHISGATQEMGMSMVIHLSWGQRLTTEDEQGEAGRAVGGICPGEVGLHVLWYWFHAGPLPPLLVLPYPSEFWSGSVSPITVGNELFLHLINTLKIQ